MAWNIFTVHTNEMSDLGLRRTIQEFELFLFLEFQTVSI